MPRECVDVSTFRVFQENTNRQIQTVLAQLQSLLSRISVLESEDTSVNINEVQAQLVDSKRLLQTAVSMIEQLQLTSTPDEILDDFNLLQVKIDQLTQQWVALSKEVEDICISPEQVTEAEFSDLLSRFNSLQTTVGALQNQVDAIGTGGVSDHGSLTGLSDDDHVPYLTHARHDALPNDNPHQVTFTQAVAEEGTTDISAAEAEQLSDGSDASSLHIHDSLYYTKTQIDASGFPTQAVTAIGELGDQISGSVVLEEGNNITISRSGQTLTLTSTASGEAGISGISVLETDTDPSGVVTELEFPDDSISISGNRAIIDLDSRYYTESEIDGFGFLTSIPDEYLTEDEYINLINASGINNSANFYGDDWSTLTDGSDASSLHVHDSRYYTESETDSIIAALDSTYISHDELDASGFLTSAVSDIGKAGDPITGSVVLAEGSNVTIARVGQTFTFSSTGGNGGTVGVTVLESDTSPSGIVTEIEFPPDTTTITGDRASVDFDSIYYTKTQIDASGFLTSLPSHDHDDRYYTQTEINASGINNSANFYGSDWLDLTDGGDTILHTHDVYLTEDEYQSLINTSGFFNSSDQIDHGLLIGLSDDDHPQYVSHTELDASGFLISIPADYLTESEYFTLIDASGFLTETSHDALPSDNPHAVTFTQAVTADGSTDISAVEAETLTDGSDADGLHIHDLRYYTKSNIDSSGMLTTASNINDISDVDIVTPSSGDVLTYNDTSGNWESQPPAGVLDPGLYVPYIDGSGDIIPRDDVTYDLGASDKRWDAFRGNKVFLSTQPDAQQANQCAIYVKRSEDIDASMIGLYIDLDNNSGSPHHTLGSYFGVNGAGADGYTKALEAKICCATTNVNNTAIDADASSASVGSFAVRAYGCADTNREYGASIVAKKPAGNAGSEPYARYFGYLGNNSTLATIGGTIEVWKDYGPYTGIVWYPHPLFQVSGDDGSVLIRSSEDYDIYGDNYQDKVKLDGTAATVEASGIHPWSHDAPNATVGKPDTYWRAGYFTNLPGFISQAELAASGFLNESAHDALPSDNPHAVTFTQAVTSDSGTDIAAAEAEQLTDGSDAGGLHIHDGRYYTESEIDAFAYLTSDEYQSLIGASGFYPRDGSQDLTGNLTFDASGSYSIGEQDKTVDKIWADAIDIADGSITLEPDGKIYTDHQIAIGDTNPTATKLRVKTATSDGYTNAASIQNQIASNPGGTNCGMFFNITSFSGHTGYATGFYAQAQHGGGSDKYVGGQFEVFTAAGCNPMYAIGAYIANKPVGFTTQTGSVISVGQLIAKPTGAASKFMKKVGIASYGENMFSEGITSFRTGSRGTMASSSQHDELRAAASGNLLYGGDKLDAEDGAYDGSVYVEKYLEVDGTAYLDGGLAVPSGSYILGPRAMVQIYDAAGATTVDTTARGVNFTAQSWIDSAYFEHDTSTNNTQLTIKSQGWYRCHYNIAAEITNSTNANLRGFLRRDGSTEISPSPNYSCTIAATEDYGSVGNTFLFQMPASGYVELMIDEVGATGGGTGTTIANESFLFIEKLI